MQFWEKRIARYELAIVRKKSQNCDKKKFFYFFIQLQKQDSIENSYFELS